MGIIQDTIGCSKNRKGKQLDQINKREIGPKKITVENTNRRSKNKEKARRYTSTHGALRKKKHTQRKWRKKNCNEIIEKKLEHCFRLYYKCV